MINVETNGQYGVAQSMHTSIVEFVRLRLGTSTGCPTVIDIGQNGKCDWDFVEDCVVSGLGDK